ncbi:GNAT family N-acetyltransferase [Streptomyces sp. bgisy084]|uniref:GNAT family N-acetyltransferase n=1 Tax=Streptomyces sp. bgisy084 TaxID=3413777 RepID=UPI003D72FBB2
MHPDDWHLTEDIDDFHTRAGEFLRSRPALHTTPLTTIETLRTRGADAFGTPGTPGVPTPVLGRLERAGNVHAIFYLIRGLSLTHLTPEHADTLAAHLAALGHSLPFASADHSTATAFAEAWQRHTGATPTLRNRIRLYRLGTLTPPTPAPEGRGRLVGEQDREQLMLFLRGFTTDVREAVTIDADSWARTRFADKHFTFWETPDGTPVSMAGATSMVGGMVRVDPVYTPAHLRGRGYAAAVTTEVSQAALTAGATDVVLYADPANPTSNALYQRLGYLPLTEWAVYDFTPTEPNAG